MMPYASTATLIAQLMAIARARDHQLTPEEHHVLRRAALQLEEVDEQVSTLLDRIEAAAQSGLYHPDGHPWPIRELVSPLRESSDTRSAADRLTCLWLGLSGVQQSAILLRRQLDGSVGRPYRPQNCQISISEGRHLPADLIETEEP